MSTPPFDSELFYLALDLECTGLIETADPEGDFDDITEFGVIGLNRNKEQLFEYRTVVLPTAHTFDRLNANPFVHKMFSDNGLLEDLQMAFVAQDAPTLADIGEHLVAMIERFTTDKDHKVVLMGSGVATYDLRFLKAQTADIAAKLQYWTNDVGVIRREWKHITGVDLVDANNDKTHRGIDDIRCHVEESRAFSQVFEKLAAAAGGGDLPTILNFLNKAEVA